MPERQEEDHAKPERSGAGMALGIVTFLVGVGLILLTFRWAYDLFSVPAGMRVIAMKDEAVDLGRSGDNLVRVLLQVLLLVVMGLMGSLIANRGVSMFTHSRTTRPRS